MRRLFLAALALLAIGGGVSLAQVTLNNGFGVVDSLPQGFTRIVSYIGNAVLMVNKDGSINTVESQRKCYPYHFLSAANTNPGTVSNSAHELCGVLIITNSASTTALDLRFKNTTNPTCSTGTDVVWNVQIPVNSTAANVAGITVPIPENIYFTNGVSWCLTGAYTDTDTTNAVTGVSVNFGVR